MRFKLPGRTEAAGFFKAYFRRLNGRYFAGGLSLSPASPDRPVWINIILFAATFITASFAGGSSGADTADYFISGIPYALSIMSILTAHEMGHYIAARRFGVKATLPYFIPFPSLAGTMGAVIKIKSPIRDTRALFYIGISGPFAGFAVSFILAVYGIYLSEILPLPPPGTGQNFLVFGDSLLFSLLTFIIHGPLPAGMDIYLSSYAWAGWLGFLITGLNLIPLGQLDGGHILYSLIGGKQRYAGWASLAGLTALSFYWEGWILWVILTLVLLMVGHPEIREKSSLSFAEKTAGVFSMLLLILTFIPVPVTVL